MVAASAAMKPSDPQGFDGVSQVFVKLEGERNCLRKTIRRPWPRVKGLGLENTGVTLNAMNLVDVNQYCQTKVPHIYAVGDVIGPSSISSISMEQGR